MEQSSTHSLINPQEADIEKELVNVISSFMTDWNRQYTSTHV